MEESNQSLQSLFESAWSAHCNLDAAESLPDDYEREVIAAWKEVELAVNSNALFSSNETLDDVQTSSLRYLLVPYFIAEAELRTRDLQNRWESLKRAEGCFTVFLMRMEKLEALNKLDRNAFNVKEGASIPAAQQRNEMIARAKEAEQEKKCIEEAGKTEILLGRIGDEEEQRDHLKMMLSYHAFNALRELNLIKQELPLLEMMRQGVQPRPKENKPKGAPSKTQREEMMNNVFRYVNPPTMTIEEAGEIEYKLMMRRQAEQDRKQHSKKKESDDDDDDDALRKTREWDDWKDDNPRGWGNRMNQG